MRSLAVILKGKDRCRREILFEEGEWCIYRRPKYGWQPADTNYMHYIIHRCAEACNAIDAEEHYKCECGETAPDSIKTLFIIQTWDR